jgi:tricorn protease
LFNQRARVYALALQPGLRFPFQPRDELAPRPESNGKAAADAAAALPMLTIDGLSQRLFEVPIAPGNYRGLGVDRERLYTIVSGHLVCGVRTLGLRYPRAGPTRAPGRGPSA